MHKWSVVQPWVQSGGWSKGSELSLERVATGGQQSSGRAQQLLGIGISQPRDGVGVCGKVGVGRLVMVVAAVVVAVVVVVDCVRCALRGVLVYGSPLTVQSK